MTSETKTSRDELLRIFTKYVDHQDKDGHQYISGPAFIKNFIGVKVDDDAKSDVMFLLTRIADTTKDGMISFDEFCAFEKFLLAPDVLYKVVFRMFDATSTGFVTFEEFKQVYCQTVAHEKVPFDFNCEFITRHFGHEKKKELSYIDFTQLIRDVQLEHLKQAFERKGKDKNGTVFPLELLDIMTTLRANSLTPFLSENMLRLADGNKLSYSVFLALNKVLSNVELLQQIFESVLKEKQGIKLKTKDVHKEEFARAALEYAEVSPLEVELLFELVSLNRESGKLTREDFDKLMPMVSEVAPVEAPPSPAEAGPQPNRSVFLAVAETVYRFALGSVAGACGATAVYPIDLVKTRLQNQRTSMIGEVMYKNFWDCFFKVIRFEGYSGLYRGLPPQLVGVAPEKAIKLTMNDFVRDKVIRPDGSIPLWGEILAGGTAGGCQVIFTNPLEIVKIRLQVAGEVAVAAKVGETVKRVSAIGVIRELGFRGLYKGARACLLRDIPFSAIYFPLYANLKKGFQDKNGTISPISLFCAGVLAGIPAPFLTTPADVIKTRLQVKPRAGQTSYNGVIDCTRKLMREEGPRAFWKGANQRVFRSAPQFGVTLLTYELLQKVLPVDFGGVPKAQPKAGLKDRSKMSIGPANPDHIGGLKTASMAFSGIERKFGLFLPKFHYPQNVHIYELTKPKAVK